MKKIFFTIFIGTLFLMILSAQDSVPTKIGFIDKEYYYLLKLPYEIDTQIDAVFDEDSPLAIEIIEIVADGKSLSFIEDIRSLDGRTYWNLKPLNSNQKIYYLSMYWYKYSNNSIRWNDGKGLFFTEIEPNLFKPNTNSYELQNTMKKVSIKYRIRMPDIGMPSKGVYPLELKENRYSNAYTIDVDLSSIW